MQRFAKLLVVGGMLWGSVLLAGCGGGSTSDDGAKAGKRGVIGYSALSLKNPFFKTIADTMAIEAEKQGFTVLVNDAASNVEKQSNHIDSYIQNQVTAIVINPADREAIGPAIKRANEAGIPVFTNDLRCVAVGVEIAGHIGTDNMQGGEVAGAAMIEVLGESGGEVAILHFPQAQSCVLRVKGFRKAIEEHNAKNPDSTIKIVAEREGGGEQDKSFKRTTELVQAFPHLSAIFAINDPSALGAYQGLSDSGKAGKITIIGFDGALAGKQAIKEGKIYADPIQFPKKMASVTIENIVKYLGGESYEVEKLIPTELYTQEQAKNDPELK